VTRRPLPPRWLSTVALVAFALLLSTYAWSMALDAYPHTAGGDGPFFHEMLEAVRASLSHYHELPLWNPYQCGGVPLWDNPQGLGASPVVLAMLPFFDTTRLMELWFVVHCTMGFLCMWVLARHELSMSIEASLFASAVWAFCGVHNQHFNGGQLVWAPFLYFPLAIYFWRKAEHDLRMAVGLGILAAWTMHEGGTYPIPYLALILGVETLSRAWPPSRLKAIARAAAVVVVVGFALGATRILPVIDQLRSHTRDLRTEVDALRWDTLKDMFLARNHSRRVAGQEYVWSSEYGAYLGPFVLALSLLGLVTTGAENVWVVVLFVWTFLLMLGHEWPWAPWHLLKSYVFPFKQMRVPSRFNGSVSLFLAVFAGLAIDRAVKVARQQFSSERAVDAVRYGLVAIAFAGVGDIMNTGFIWPEVNGFNHAPADPNVAVSPRLYLDGPGLADFIDQPHQNRGRTQCWEEWAFEQGAPLWAGDVPQARAADDRAVVTAVDRTQNSFVLDVDANRPARILLNSGFDRGWGSDEGTVVREGKQLAVDVSPGHHHVVVKYWPHGLTLGFFLLGAGVAGVTAFFVRDAKRRRARTVGAPSPPNPPSEGAEAGAKPS
jgi:hypothetical protein